MRTAKKRRISHIYEDVSVKEYTLEEIVRRNTSMVAKHFDIKERGELKEGNYADIAVIDLEAYNYPSPQEVDYRKPLTMASGVDTVLVNGKAALEKGELRKPFSGKVLRRG